MSEHQKGQCQCGAVRYQAAVEPFIAYTCHCRECQRLSSSAFATCAQVPAESVTISTGTASTRVRATDTGHELATWFCPNCGSTVFAQNSARPRIRTVYVGTLDEPESIQVAAHIWLKRALNWFIPPEGHRCYQGAGDWTEDYRRDPERYRNQ